MKTVVAIVVLSLLVGVAMAVRRLVPEKRVPLSGDLKVSSRISPGISPRAPVSASATLPDRSRRQIAAGARDEERDGADSGGAGVPQEIRSTATGPEIPVSQRIPHGISTQPSLSVGRSLPLLDIVIPFFNFLQTEKRQDFYSEKLGKMREEMISESIIRPDEFRELSTEAATMAFFEKFLEYEIIEKRGGNPEMLEEKRRFLRESYDRLRRGNFFQK